MQTDDVIDLARRLIAIDSVNPTLVPGGAGEHEIARFVERWAAENGLATRVIPSPDGRPNLVIGDVPADAVDAGTGAAGAATPGAPVLMLYGHLDTVGLGSMAAPLEPRIDGDRLTGRGAYDQKAGLAAALVAAREFAREAGRSGARGHVIVVAVADEEAASTGIQEVLRHVRADGAVITEPTEMAVGIGHRGFAWIEIEVRGVAAHGSRPHLGVDAIFRTGPVITALERYTDRLALRPHPLLGAGLLHASLIQGGSEMATLPDRCLLSVERRTLPGETPVRVLAEIEAVLDACRAADPALVASARVTLARDPFEIAADDPFVALVRGATARVTGAPPGIAGLSFWADSAYIAAAGIPTVLLGPPGEGAHADDEWVSVSGTVACARALVEIGRDFCG
ncbi:MAG: M20/M25/M40 family metallo-hydrolase [Chloroflexota bacterium]|nr:M20/M25/M40 family metallo-hydrolase [Chloroflexota bacterium]